MKNALIGWMPVSEAYRLQNWECVLLHDLQVFGYYVQFYDVCVHLSERRYV